MRKKPYELWFGHSPLVKYFRVFGSKDKGVMTRNKVNGEICLISLVEPKSTDEVVRDGNWIQAMKEQLDQ